jgi:hypothetical protein
MKESNSLANITISDSANEICELLIADGLVSDAIEAYRLALCLAIGLDLPVDRSVRMTKNKWDTGAVFRARGKDIESLLRLFDRGGDDPVLEGKLLAEAGLRYLKSKRDENADLLGVLINVTP